MRRNKILNTITPMLIAALLVLAVVLLVGCKPGHNGNDMGASYNTAIYTEQGGAKQVVASGGEIQVESGATLDVQSGASFNIGSLYPVGYASAGQQLVYGTTEITGTGTAAHGLTTVTFCAASLGEDPTSGAGEAAMVTTAVSTNTCTLKAWQDDFVTAATEADVAVHWIVVGAP